MNDFVINKEAWHETWLRGYEKVSRQFLAREYGNGNSKAFIVRFNSTDAFKEDKAIYEVHGQFLLPRGGATLCSNMALHTLAKDVIVPPELIKGELKRFPDETFFLQALLEACYPYKSDGKGFKAHAELMVGYEDVDGLMSEMGPWAAATTAFFGFGYVLMQKVRQSIDPLASVSQIIERSGESYLCVQERKKNG